MSEGARAPDLRAPTLAASDVSAAIGLHSVRQPVYAARRCSDKAVRKERAAVPSGADYTNRRVRRDHHIVGKFEKELEDALRAFREACAESNGSFCPGSEYIQKAARDAASNYAKRMRAELGEGCFFPALPDMVERCVSIQLHKLAGRLGESDIIRAFERDAKTAVTQQQSPVEGTVHGIRISGRIDGVAWGDTVVEVKTRVASTLGSARGSSTRATTADKVQLHVYMFLLGLRKGILVSRPTNAPPMSSPYVCRVPWDQAFWDETIVPGLVRFQEAELRCATDQAGSQAADEP